MAHANRQLTIQDIEFSQRFLDWSNREKVKGTGKLLQGSACQAPPKSKRAPIVSEFVCHFSHRGVTQHLIERENGEARFSANDFGQAAQLFFA